jgi:hypothetical protein
VVVATAAVGVEVAVAKNKIFAEGREREREVLRPPREVVRRLLVVNIMVDKTLVGVVVAEGHDGERKKEEKAIGNQKPGEKMIFS